MEIIKLRRSKFFGSGFRMTNVEDGTFNDLGLDVFLHFYGLRGPAIYPGDRDHNSRYRDKSNIPKVAADLHAGGTSDEVSNSTYKKEKGKAG